MKKLFRYYVRKFQAVTAREASVSANLESICIVDGNVISFLYFPLVVRHNLYATPLIAQICHVLTSAPSSTYLIGLSGIPQEKVNAAICHKAYLSLERETPVLDESGNPTRDAAGALVKKLIRRRFGLWFSKFVSSDDVVSRFSYQK